MTAGHEHRDLRVPVGHWRTRARVHRPGVGSHGGDGLIVEGDKGHAKRLLVHLLLLPLVVLLQLLLQLRVVLNGLYLPGRARQALGQELGWCP